MNRKVLCLVGTLLVVALLALSTIPFLLRASDHAKEARTQRAGIALLHHFDCTYGRSLSDLLSSGAYSTSLQAAASYDLAKSYLDKGQQPAAKATLKIARAQELRAADLLRQWGQLKPLTTPAQLRLLPPEQRTCSPRS